MNSWQELVQVNWQEELVNVDRRQELVDRPKMRCVKCVPKCASARVAPSNIVYYCTDIDPQGKVN